jgi:hypothetical protein
MFSEIVLEKEAVDHRVVHINFGIWQIWQVESKCGVERDIHVPSQTGKITKFTMQTGTQNSCGKIRVTTRFRNCSKSNLAYIR